MLTIQILLALIEASQNMYTDYTDLRINSYMCSLKQLVDQLSDKITDLFLFLLFLIILIID